MAIMINREVRPQVTINKNQQFTNIDLMVLIIQVKKIFTSPVQVQYSLLITPHHVFKIQNGCHKAR